jgi:osmotically-inducible protein OsmY
MKQHKIAFLLVLAAATLAVGTLACAQDKLPTAGVQADAKLGTEPAVAAAKVSVDAAPPYAEPSAADWKTKLQVEMALLENLGTDGLRVAVTSSDGGVTLGGTVEKRETRELAETMAKSIPSVTSVRNDIRLESSLDNPNKAGVAAGEAEAEWKDAMLSTKVRLALVDVLGSDGFRIGTEVASGMVALEFAPELTETRRAEALEAARGVEGVAKVVSVDKT